jgi:hypothetical protein
MSDDNDLDFDVEDTEVEQVNDGDVTDSDTEVGTETEQAPAQTDGPVPDAFPAPAETVTPTADPSTTEGAATEPTAEEKAAEQAKADAELAEAEAKFQAAVEAVLANEEKPDWGGTPPEVVVSPVLVAYGELPGAKGKSAGKKYLTEQMQAKMLEGTTDPSAFFDARIYMVLGKAIEDAKGTRAPVVAKPKADPVEAHVERAAALMLAVNLLPVPDDVAGTDWASRTETLVDSLAADVEKYRSWAANTAEDKGDAPEVSPVVLAAAKIAQGRAVGARKAITKSGAPRAATVPGGPRGNIAEHIKQAMETVAVGDFMTIAEIAKYESTEYGTDGKPAPSQGAISARLFPGGDASKCTLDFVQPEGTDQGRAVKGAVRTK